MVGIKRKTTKTTTKPPEKRLKVVFIINDEQIPRYRAPNMKTLPLFETINISSMVQNGYKNGRVLGRGSFGVVQELTVTSTGTVVACKSIAKDAIDARYLRTEVDMMTKFRNHPNIVHLEAVYEDDKYLHLLMGLCKGGNIGNRISRCGIFRERQAIYVFRQILQTVEHLHKHHVIHRDLKPENILLATSSNLDIKIADFGLSACVRRGKKLTGIVGTPAFMAPEVIAGRCHTYKGDVWSCGVILFVMLCGLQPFWGQSVSQISNSILSNNGCVQFYTNIWDGISGNAKDIITRMLSFDPGRRPNAKQLLAHPWFQQDDQLMI